MCTIENSLYRGRGGVPILLLIFAKLTIIIIIIKKAVPPHQFYKKKDDKLMFFKAPNINDTMRMRKSHEKISGLASLDNGCH